MLLGSVVGKGAAATAAALKSKALQSALQTVESAGTKRMSDFIGRDVNGLTQADLPRYGMAAKGKLIDFLNENLASGELTVQQANRLIKAIPYHYSGDGTAMARELTGGSLSQTSRMMFRGVQARADIASGAAKGVFRQGPEELSTYLHGKLLQSQNKVMGIVDEWH